MPLQQSVAGQIRYLVSATDGVAALQSFLASLASEPDIELLDVLGPPGSPHTAVIRTSGATARALTQRFDATHQLTIEPDQPLSLD